MILYFNSYNYIWLLFISNPSLCPVKAIEAYVASSREIGVDLSRGFLFHAMNAQGHIVEKPFASAAAESRLKIHLRNAHIYNGKTLHSFRAGCALTLAFSGSPLADVMSHIGWSSSSTASYYLKLADVIRAGAPADLLASHEQKTEEASRTYTEFNALKDFISALPA